MRDEIDGRMWVDHHEAFSAGVDRALEAIRLTFCKFNRIQFQAPWRKQGSC